ncbi:MAG: hypothetical protein K8I02_04730, partial [Candidatus Methylomirabilis sp.]|nr:hypothetical protein [Deltaproteobacteria bacterium]
LALAKAGMKLEAAESLEALWGDYGPDASLAWRLGRLYRELANPGASAQWYRLALSNDCRPRRATRRTREVLRDFARERDLPLADAAAYFESVSPRGLVGERFLQDDCHLNEDGQAFLVGFISDAVAGLVAEGRLGRPPSKGGLARDAHAARARAIPRSP